MSGKVKSLLACLVMMLCCGAFADSMVIDGKTLYFTRDEASGAIRIEQGSIPYSGRVFIPSLETFCTGDSVTGYIEFADGVFRDNTEITAIDLAEGVNIEFRESMFSGCTKLEEITGSVYAYYIPDRCFYDCQSLNMMFYGSPMSVGEEAFYNCKSLTSIDLTSTLQIARSAFEGCTSLACIEIGTSCGWSGGGYWNEISSRAFFGCTALEYITLGPSIQRMYGECFANTPNLKSFTILDDSCIDYDSMQAYGGLMLEPSMFYEYNSYNDGFGRFEMNIPKWVEIWDWYYGDDLYWSYHVVNGICEISGYSYRRRGIYQFPTEIKGHPVSMVQSYQGNDFNCQVAIVKDIPYIPDYAFMYCSKTDAFVFENIDSLGDALVGAKYIKSLTFKNVKDMSGLRFLDCINWSTRELNFIDVNWEFPENLFGVYDSWYKRWIYAEQLRTVYHNGHPPAGLLGTHPKDIMIFQWDPEFHDEWLNALEVKGKTPMVRVFDGSIMTDDPSVVQVSYRAYTGKPSGYSRAVAFKDGVRSFANVVKINSINDINAVGDEHSMIKMQDVRWRIPTDLDVESMYLTVEVLARDDLKIPDLKHLPDEDLFSFLLWEFADENSRLSLIDGSLYVDNELVARGSEIVNKEKAVSLFDGFDKGGALIAWSDSELLYWSNSPFSKANGVVVDHVNVPLFSTDPSFVDGQKFEGAVNVVACDWNLDGLQDFIVFSGKDCHAYTNVGSSRAPEYRLIDAEEEPALAPLKDVYVEIMNYIDKYPYPDINKVISWGNASKHGIYLNGPGYIYSNIRTLFYSFEDHQVYDYYEVSSYDGHKRLYADRYFVDVDGTECLLGNLFRDETELPPEQISSLSTGDIDGDGHDDLIIASIDNTIWCYRRGEDGYMHLLTKNWAGSAGDLGSRLSVSLIDWDNDGRMDCLVGNKEGKLMLIKDCKSIQPTSISAKVGVDSVMLDWAPSIKGGCKGYNVYRRAEEETDFVKINTELIPVPNYRDKALAGSYEYRVSSVCRYYEPGNSAAVISESDLSDEVAVELGKVALSWTDASAKIGEQVKVSLSIDNSMSISPVGLSVEIEYDESKLRLTKMTPSELIDQSKIAPGSGKLYEFTFDVIATAEGEAEVALKDATFYGVGGAMVPVVTPSANAKVTISKGNAVFKPGDVTGDGVVNAEDLRYMTKLISGGSKRCTANELKAGDLNGNGKLDNADYQQLRAIVYK